MINCQSEASEEPILEGAIAQEMASDTRVFFAQLAEALGLPPDEEFIKMETLMGAAREVFARASEFEDRWKRGSEKLFEAEGKTIALSLAVESLTKANEELTISLERESNHWSGLTEVYLSRSGEAQSALAGAARPEVVGKWFLEQSNAADCLRQEVAELEAALLIQASENIISLTNLQEGVLELNLQRESDKRLLGAVADSLDLNEGSTSALPDCVKSLKSHVLVLSDAFSNLLLIHGDYFQILKTVHNLGAIPFDKSSSRSYIRKLLEEDSQSRCSSASAAQAATSADGDIPIPSSGCLCPETEQIVTKLCTDHYRLLSAEATIRKYTPEVIRLRRKIPMLTTEANSLRQQLNNVKVLRSQSESRLKSLMQDREENQRRTSIRDLSLRSDFEDKYDREVQRHATTQTALKEMEEQMDRLQQQLDEQTRLLQEKEEECLLVRQEYENEHQQIRRERLERESLSRRLEDSQRMLAVRVSELDRAGQEADRLESAVSEQTNRLRSSEAMCERQRLELRSLCESCALSAEDWASARCREQEWRVGLHRILDSKSDELRSKTEELETRSQDLAAALMSSSDIQQEAQRNAFELDDMRKQVLQLEEEKRLAKYSSCQSPSLFRQCCSIA